MIEPTDSGGGSRPGGRTVSRSRDGFTSYHSHSTWSDGHASIREMVQAAETVGLDEFGMSDHYVLTPTREQLWWSMPLDRVGEYVEEVQSIAAEASITVRLGIEVDFFPETLDEVVDRLSPFPFDYRIGSIHFVDRFPIDASADDWAPLAPAQVTEKHRLYWRRVRQMAETGVFDFLGHLDLPKKFGFRPAVPLDEEIDVALAAIAAAGTPIELNTAGWDKPCREPYPSAELLGKCCEAGIPVLMNDDSHSTDAVGGHFAEGARLLQEAGCAEVARFAGRKPRESELPPG